MQSLKTSKNSTLIKTKNEPLIFVLKQIAFPQQKSRWIVEKASQIAKNR
jgi:hypothetical protein